MTPAGFQKKLNEARQLLLGRDFAQALSCYAKLTRTLPGQAVVWFEYGNAASRLGQLEGASRAWERAMQLEPRNAELVVQIGHQYQGLRKPEQARVWFARAAAADSKVINPRISLAVLLEQQHRLDEARAAVEECLAIDPRDDQARYLSAVLDRRENQLEAAESRLRQLIQSDPKHPYVRYACRYELAQILDRTGRFDEAMTLLAEAKEIVRAWVADTNCRGHVETSRGVGTARPRDGGNISRGESSGPKGGRLGESHGFLAPGRPPTTQAKSSRSRALRTGVSKPFHRRPGSSHFLKSA